LTKVAVCAAAAVGGTAVAVAGVVAYSVGYRLVHPPVRRVAALRRHRENNHVPSPAEIKEARDVVRDVDAARAEAAAAALAAERVEVPLEEDGADPAPVPEQERPQRLEAGAGVGADDPAADERRLLATIGEEFPGCPGEEESVELELMYRAIEVARTAHAPLVRRLWAWKRAYTYAMDHVGWKLRQGRGDVMQVGEAGFEAGPRLNSQRVSRIEIYYSRLGKARFGVPQFNDANRLAVRTYVERLMRDDNVRTTDAARYIDATVMAVFVPTQAEAEMAAVMRSTAFREANELAQCTTSR
jgi:hypothetical protein